MQFHRHILDNALFHSATFSLFNKRIMLSTGWGLSKGDWWYGEDPSDKKFFDISKEEYDDTTQYGIYIARLSLVLMASEN